MTTATATITGTITVPSQAKAATVTVKFAPYTENLRLVHPDGVVEGWELVTIDPAAGTWTIDLPLTGQSGVEPAGALWQAQEKATNGAIETTVFDLTGDIDWGDIVPVTDLPFTPSLLQQAQTAATDAQTAATAAEAAAVALDMAIGTGIDPTGATASDVAIQAKITALAAGGRLTIPSGTYMLNNPLIINYPMHLQGVHAYSTRLVPGPSFPNGQAMIQFVRANGGTYLDQSHLTGIDVSDLLLEGNGRVPQVHGISLNFVGRSRFRNVEMRWLRGSAWQLISSCVELEWIGCDTWGCGDVATDAPVLDIRDSSAPGFDGHNLLHFTNCDFAWNCGDGAVIGTMNDAVSVRAVYFIGSTIHQITEGSAQQNDPVHGALGVTINRPSGVTGIPVRVADASDVWFIGSRLHDPPRGFPTIRLESANSSPQNTVGFVGSFGSITTRGASGYTGVGFTADATADALTMTAGTVHDMSTGSRFQVKIGSAGGVLPTPLAIATDYYAIRVSATVVKLATSRANALAGTAIDLSDAGSGSLSLAQYDYGVTVDPSSDTLTAADHVLRTGARVQIASTGSIPGGIAASTDYFVIATGSDTFKLATTRVNALAGTAIDITDAGSGNVFLTTQDFWADVELGTLSVGGSARIDGTPKRAYVKTAASQTLNFDPLTVMGLSTTVPLLEKSDLTTVFGTPSAWLNSVAPPAAQPIRAVKTANESRLNTTSSTADAELFLNLTPGTWKITGWLLVDGATTGDFNVQWFNTGTGWTGSVQFSGQATSATTNVGSQFNQVTSRGSTVGRGMIGVGTPLGMPFNGYVIATTTAQFKIQWAQTTADAVNATTVYAGSWLEAAQLA